MAILFTRIVKSIVCKTRDTLSPGAEVNGYHCNPVQVLLCLLSIMHRIFSKRRPQVGGSSLCVAISGILATRL